MLDACRDIINTVPPLYFFVGWGWARVFGSSEFALRSFSSLAFCGAFWVMWIVLQPRYGSFAATLGLLAAFLSQHVLLQNDQARFYGFYLLTCALAVFQYARLMEAQTRFDWKSYAFNFLTHAAMVFTHTFGFLYSGCILLTGLALMRQDRKRQATFLLSVVLAWLVFFLLWGKTFFHHMRAFQYSWIPVPTFGRLVSTLFWCRAVELLLLLGTVSVAISTVALRKSVADSGVRPHFDHVRERALPLLGAFMLVLPTGLVWTISRIGTSCFLERYLLPEALAWALILAYGVYRVRLHFARWSSHWESQIKPLWRRVMSFAFLLGLMLFLTLMPSPLSGHVRRTMDGLLAGKETFPRPDDFVDKIADGTGISNDLPIVCTFIHRYNQSFFYSPKPSRYFFLLDREYALADKKKAGLNVTDYLLMDALKRNYPDQNICPWESFVDTHSRFLVLEEKDSTWSDFRLLSNPDFLRSEVFQDQAAGIRFWLITRSKN